MLPILKMWEKDLDWLQFIISLCVPSLFVPNKLIIQSSSSPSVPNPTPQGISAGPAPFTFYTGSQSVFILKNTLFSPFFPKMWNISGISSNSVNGNGLSPFSDEDMGFELMEETPEEEEVEPNRYTFNIWIGYFSRLKHDCKNYKFFLYIVAVL